ncbi:MAG TPA: apolipoprotein N-acyltransferase [Jatrophihabitans sp.]|nr:apolipoprotein N-acyltransferase [Jatrophihabitans sp.]
MKRRFLLALASGLIGVLAFPPFGFWPLAMVSVAGLSVAVHRVRCRSGAWLGLVFGAGLFGPMLHWTATYVGALPWLLLAFSQTWYLAALGALLPLAQRTRWAPAAVGTLWVAEEAVRDRLPFGGFPWGRWAFSQADSPLRWFAPIGGMPLISFAVALSGGWLAMGVLDRRRRPRLAALVAAVLVVGLGAGLSWPLKPRLADDRSVTVAAIQGDVPDRGLEFNARRRQVLDNHVNQTLQLAADIRAGTVPRPVMVLWPENASDIDPTDNTDAAQQIQRATDAVGVPILVGAVLDGPGENHVSNVGLVWMPTSSTDPGPGQRYVKRHPVPFAEYIPLRSLARRVSDKVDLVQRDMVSGSGNGLLSQLPVPVGDVICFEVAYDSLVNSSVRAGAQLLVVQTNNATFGHSGETYQQLAMSKLRAIEHARTVVQVATSGKSAIIDPTGRTVASSGALFTPAILVRTVPLSTSTTLATRLGATVEWLLVAIAAIAMLDGGRPVRGRLAGRRAATARTRLAEAAAHDERDDTERASTGRQRQPAERPGGHPDVQRAGEPAIDRPAADARGARGARPGGG